MVMSLFGEFETSLLGTSNDDNPHVFVMFKTYGEPFLDFSPNWKKELEENSGLGDVIENNNLWTKANKTSD